MARIAVPVKALVIVFDGPRTDMAGAASCGYSETGLRPEIVRFPGAD